MLWTDAGPEIRFLAGKLETRGWSVAAGADKEQARREAIRLLYVAVTRAMDHVVIGCYHSPPVGANAQRSGAQQLWELLSGDGLAVTETALTDPGAVPDPSALPDPPFAPVAGTLPDRDAHEIDRRALLRAVRQRVATSPTAPAVEPDTVAEDAAPNEAAPPPPTRWRRSSRGAAIGTATHRVLELIDLKHPDPQQVRRLTRLACAEQQLPDLQADIEGRVWSALGSPALQGSLMTDARALSEVYLVVRDGDRFLEGYIDLLIDGGPGALTILDYKTDRATSAADIAAKRQQYAPQLAAYARAVEQITGRAPSMTDLVFARPGGLSPGAPRPRQGQEGRTHAYRGTDDTRH